MKKIFLILFLFLSFNIKVVASTETASSYVLMDMDSNNVIMSKDKDKTMLIASITKIMTCILAIENGNLDDVVVVDDTINDSIGSGIYISVSEKITLRDLLYGLMLRSGNDAALMISKYVGGSVSDFVSMMNEKAKLLGMKNSIFYNPSGLDNVMGNLSTAYDMALLTSYAMKNDVYREIVSTKKYICKTNLKTYIWYNKNKLLGNDFITGGKTGYTEKAKRTLVSTGSKDNMNFVVVTLRDSDDWNTHLDLYDYAFSNYQRIKILDKNKFYVMDNNIKDKLYIKNDVYLTLKKEDNKKLVNHIKLNKFSNYKNGSVVGSSNIYLDDKLLYKEDIYVNKKDNKSIFSRIKEWFND